MNKRSIYLGSMQKSVLDKLFFAGILDLDAVVDFGCADNTVLRHYKLMFGDAVVVGYDRDPKMLEAAQYAEPFVPTTDQWGVVEGIFEHHAKGNSALLLSSVLHEVFHYLPGTVSKEVMNKIWTCGAKYIVIRDMIGNYDMNRWADPLDVAKVRQNAVPAHLMDHENRWGPIEDQRSLLQFLLTYPFVENWDTEVKENYFALDREVLLGSVPKTYKPIYSEQYTLPFVKHRVLKDFGVAIHDQTHIKLILEKR